jgi:K+-sensing histidine kinase KdpD
MTTSKAERASIVIGPLAALVVSASTSSVRDQVGATNVGIALAIIVVLAALTGRVAGLLTAAVAAISFNFFHTQPYHSLRVHESRDVVIIALLLVLGFVVSDITAWRRRRDAIAFRHGTAAEAPQRITEMLQSPQPVGAVWPAIATMIMDQLTLADVSFVPGSHTDLPLISRTGALHAGVDDGFVLPSHGAAMPIVSGNNTLGHLVLRPQQGITSLWVERRVVVALADHLTIALTYTGHETGRGSFPKGQITNG